MTHNRDFQDIERLAYEYKTADEIIANDLTSINKTKIKKPVDFRERKKIQRERMLKLKIQHNVIQEVAIAISNLSDSIYKYHPLCIEMETEEKKQQQGILLGHDHETNEEVRLLTEHLAADIVSVGTTRSGKSLFNHIFINNMFLYTDQICLVYLDFKGEVAQSLSYKIDGKTETILAKRITEIKKYEKGMLNSMFEKDTIIVINLAYVKNDEVLFRNTILEVLEDVNSKLSEFQDEFIKETSDGFKARIAELPYKIGLCFEEAYKIFPNMKSSVYASIRDTDTANINRRKILKEQLKEHQKSDDIDLFEQTKKELEEMPEGVMQTHHKIMNLAKENSNTMGYLGLWSIYICQRFAELDTSIIAQSATWMIHNVNSTTDLKSLSDNPKVNNNDLKEFFDRIPENLRQKYMLLSSPSAKCIVRKPKPALFHKALSQSLDRRTDLQNEDELT